MVQPKTYAAKHYSETQFACRRSRAANRNQARFIGPKAGFQGQILRLMDDEQEPAVQVAVRMRAFSHPVRIEELIAFVHEPAARLLNYSLLEPPMLPIRRCEVDGGVFEAQPRKTLAHQCFGGRDARVIVPFLLCAFVGEDRDPAARLQHGVRGRQATTQSHQRSSGCRSR